MSDDPSAIDPSAAPTSPGLDTTIQLIERAQAGDGHALNLLLERHRAPLARWARGRLPRWARDLADTDDLVQDTLLHTFRNIDRFEVRGPGGLQAFLRKALINRVRDELRKKSRRPEMVGLDGVDVSGPDSPLESAIGREVLDRYHRALSALAPEDREAIIGRIEMGYSYEELADALGRPSPEAARKFVQRALVRLVRLMNDGQTLAAADPGGR